MSRIVAVLLLVMLILSACATNTPVSTTGSETDILSEPVVKTDFVPTNPNQVRLAAGKPQFIEFFAFW
jgi:hypothetical protein